MGATREPYAAEPRTEFFPLRALAGVDEMVLAGEISELDAHYPSVGGDGEAGAAWPAVKAALAAHSPEVLADLRHPLQTNETSRCGPLAGGFHVIAARDRLPVRALELGSSAGLNLHFDRYRYEADGVASGPPDSAVRFTDYWLGGLPPFDAQLEVVERAGCDIDPIDISEETGRQPPLLCDAGRLAPYRDDASGDRDRIRRPGRGRSGECNSWVEGRLAELAAGVSTMLFIRWRAASAPVAPEGFVFPSQAGQRWTEAAYQSWMFI